MGGTDLRLGPGLDQVDEVDGTDALAPQLAPLQQSLGQLAAQHARTAGDENPHCVSPGERQRHPRPMNGMPLAMTVIVSTLASGGRLAM